MPTCRPPGLAPGPDRLARALAGRPRPLPEFVSPTCRDPPQPFGCTPNAQASSVNVANASTVLLMMMRVTRPLSAP